MAESEQSLLQKKIALAQSEHASIILELIKDVTSKNPIIADTEFKTLVNAITLDVESSLMLRLADYIAEIRLGKLLDQK